MRILLAAVIATLAVPVLAAQDPGSAKDSVEADPAAAAIVADCSARKFETSVELVREGKKRVTRLKLCSTAGSDDLAWAKTLQDAKAKIAANAEISDESKARIAAELDVEVAKYQKVETARIRLPDAAPPPASSPPRYSAYPQLPTAPAKAATVATPGAMPARPRLTIRCLEPGEKGEGTSCKSLDRGTRLAIRAEENLGGDTSLRFLRRGDVRAELAIAGMQSGQSMRSKLPTELCAGVVTSMAEIQVVRGNQVVDRHGPYKLRC